MTVVMVEIIESHVRSMMSHEERLLERAHEEGITPAEYAERYRAYLRFHIAREHVQLGLNVMRKGLEIAEEAG